MVDPEDPNAGITTQEDRGHQEEGWHGLQDFGPQSESLHSMLSESSQIHQPTTCSFFVFALDWL